MCNPPNHTDHRGGFWQFSAAPELPQAQAFERLTYTLFGSDRTADQLYFNSVHSDLSGCRSRSLLGSAAAHLYNLLTIAQLGEGFERRFDQIMGIRRAQPFGQHIANPGQFDHRSNSTG